MKATENYIELMNSKELELLTPEYLRERDVPATAQGLLESLGKVTAKSLKLAGVDSQDIAVLKKYKLI